MKAVKSREPLRRRLTYAFPIALGLILLFNSRGVGESSGWPSFTGLTEAKDLEELVQWGLGAVKKVKSVVLIVRAIVFLVDEISPWSLIRATRTELS